MSMMSASYYLANEGVLNHDYNSSGYSTPSIVAGEPTPNYVKPTNIAMPNSYEKFIPFFLIGIILIIIFS